MLARIILLFFLLLFLLMNFCDHYFFRTIAYDYGAYNFAFHDYAHFRNSLSPLYGPHNFKFIQDHVSFTLVLFVPLYWMFAWLTGTYTLLFIQTFLIILGGWAVYRLLEFKTSDKLIAICGLLYYFLLYGRWSSIVMDCNLAIMASSVVPVFIYFTERKKWHFAVAALLFILLTREDMALWMVFIGMFLLVLHRGDRMYRNFSLLVIALSLAYFVFVFSLFIPLIETAEKKYTLFNYSALGKGPMEALGFIILHPVKTFLLFFQNNSDDPNFNNAKLEFYAVYLLSGGLILFFRPIYLLLFIPILAKKMLNDSPVRWGIELYYSIEFVSIMPIAVYLVLSSLRDRLLQKVLAVLVCTVTLAVTIYEFNTRHHIIQWWDNSKYAFYAPGMYKADFNAPLIHHYLGKIPVHAKVSASCKLLPHLAFRKNIYYFPRVNDAEFIAVFRKEDSYPLSQADFDREVEKYTASREWKILADEFPLLILERVKNDGP